MTRALLASLIVVTAGSAAAVTTHKHATDARAVVAPPLLSREPELRATRSFRRPPLTGRRRAHRDPVWAHGQQRWHNWAGLARCESGGNPRAVDPSGTYFGLYQFDLRTWRAVGGHGNPAEATPAEQTYRAELLYADRGREPWPVCGRRWLS